MAAMESAADLLVLTEKSLLPSMRMLGNDEGADELIRATTAYINDPENAEIVALARERGFRWMEDGD
jgi:hypothetical protein